MNRPRGRDCSLMIFHPDVTSLQGLSNEMPNHLIFGNIKIKISLHSHVSTTEKGYAIQRKSSKNVTINKFKYQVPQEGAVKLEGRLLENVQFAKSDFKDATKQILISEEVDKKGDKIKKFRV